MVMLKQARQSHSKISSDHDSENFCFTTTGKNRNRGQYLDSTAKNTSIPYFSLFILSEEAGKSAKLH